MGNAEYFDLIRQLARGDHEAYQRRCEELDEKGWEGLGYVVGATFFQAVREELRSADMSEVIHFVADARSEILGTGFDIDPKAGEALVRAALSGETHLTDTLEPAQVVETELLLLWKLLNTRTDSELEELFTKSEMLATRWAS
jgi:hypothetical protein